jgi:hypothetical protein
VDKKHLADAPITVLLKSAHFNPQRYEKFASLLPRWLESVSQTNLRRAMNTKDLGYTDGLGSATFIFITLVSAKKNHSETEFAAGGVLKNFVQVKVTQATVVLSHVQRHSPHSYCFQFGWFFHTRDRGFLCLVVCPAVASVIPPVQKHSPIPTSFAKA